MTYSNHKMLKTNQHGGTRRGRGQPPTRGVAQTERLTVRLTEAERAEIEAAVPDGVSVSWWIVEAALDRARREHLPSMTPVPEGTK